MKANIITLFTGLCSQGEVSSAAQAPNLQLSVPGWRRTLKPFSSSLMEIRYSNHLHDRFLWVWFTEVVEERNGDLLERTDAVVPLYLLQRERQTAEGMFFFFF